MERNSCNAGIKIDQRILSSGQQSGEIAPQHAKWPAHLGVDRPIHSDWHYVQSRKKAGLSPSDLAVNILEDRIAEWWEIALSWAAQPNNHLAIRRLEWNPQSTTISVAVPPALTASISR